MYSLCVITDTELWLQQGCHLAGNMIKLGIQQFRKKKNLEKPGIREFSKKKVELLIILTCSAVKFWFNTKNLL